MVIKAEFFATLSGLIESSTKAKAAADNVVAVANVDTSKIAEGIYVLLTWAMKIVGMLFEEVNGNTALKAKMMESGRMLSENSTVFFNTLAKMGILPSLPEVANNIGLTALFGKIIGFVMLGGT